MSIDPFTGRNPSYCFVELATKDEATEAMTELQGQLVLGRPMRIGEGVIRSPRKRSWDARRLIFDRWVRSDAPDHWKGY